MTCIPTDRPAPAPAPPATTVPAHKPIPNKPYQLPQSERCSRCNGQYGGIVNKLCIHCRGLAPLESMGVYEDFNAMFLGSTPEDVPFIRTQGVPSTQGSPSSTSVPKPTTTYHEEESE